MEFTHVLGELFGGHMVIHPSDECPQNPKHSLADFRALRERNLRLLKSVSKKKWQNYGMHAERGKETIQRVVEMIAGHDRNHLGQVERLVRQARGR